MNSKQKTLQNLKECANCLKSGANLKCAKCKAVSYCSKSCQKQHWKNGHKELCFTPEERRPTKISSTWVDSGSLLNPRAAEDEGVSWGECPVCLDTLSGCEVSTLPCRHSFHRQCVEQLRKHGVQQACPLCRVALPDSPQKLFRDAFEIFASLSCEMGGYDQLWQSFTESQQIKMDTAIDMFTNAANQSHVDAQFYLGSMHEKGTGVSQDHKEAMQWYRKAADQDFVHAQYKLGVMFGNGTGVAQDNKEAIIWYRKAAEKGNGPSQCNLGIAYSVGKGIAQDYKEAVQWFRKAADQGLSDAQCNLGIHYENGQGVVKDSKKAVQWYRKAAEQGVPEAQCNLGSMFFAGVGVAQDLKQAALWYRKSADQGYAQAIHNLKVCKL